MKEKIRVTAKVIAVVLSCIQLFIAWGLVFSASLDGRGTLEGALLASPVYFLPFLTLYFVFTSSQVKVSSILLFRVSNKLLMEDSERSHQSADGEHREDRNRADEERNRFCTLVI
jgi:hypothetical protein